MHDLPALIYRAYIQFGFFSQKLKTFSLSLCLVFFLIFANAQTAYAWCQSKIGNDFFFNFECAEGQGLSWNQNCLFYSINSRGLEGALTFRMQNEVFSIEEIQQTVERSFHTWNEVACHDSSFPLFAQETQALSICNKAEFHAGENNVNTIAFIDDWEERRFDPNALALTFLHFNDEGIILDADILVQKGVGVFSDCDTNPDCGLVYDAETQTIIQIFDLQNIITHEVGHFFGLAHSEDEQATMFASQRAGETEKRSLHEDDIEGICAMYSEIKTEQDCESIEPPYFDPDCYQRTDGTGGESSQDEKEQSEDTLVSSPSSKNSGCSTTQSDSTNHSTLLVVLFGIFSGIIRRRLVTG